MNNDVILIGYVELEKIFKFLELQIIEETKIISEINNIYLSMNENYKSKENNLSEICEGIISNMNKNKNNHNSNLLLINRRIEHVKRLLAEAKKMDENVQIGRIG